MCWAETTKVTDPALISPILDKIEPIEIFLFQIQICVADSDEVILKVLLVAPKLFDIAFKNFQEGGYTYRFILQSSFPISESQQIFGNLRNLDLSVFDFVILCLSPNLLPELSQLSEEVDPCLKYSDEVLSSFLDSLGISGVATLPRTVPTVLTDIPDLFRTGPRSDLTKLLNQKLLKSLPPSNSKVKLIQINRFLTSIDFCADNRLKFSAVKFILSQSVNLMSAHLKIQKPSLKTIGTAWKSDDSCLLEEDEAKLNNRTKSRCPYVYCTIEGHKFTLLVDSGSEVTLMSETFYNKLKSLTKVDFPCLPTTGIFIRGVTGVKSKRVAFQSYINFEFDGKTFPKSVFVVAGVSIDFVLGTDFLEQYAASVNYLHKSLSLLDGKIEVPWIIEKTLDSTSISVGSVTCGDGTHLHIVADSHGRGLADILIPHFKANSSVRVGVDFKPGARFSEVVSNACKISANFNENDVLVIIAGTNNIKPGKDPNLMSDFNLEPLKDLKCQIIIFEIFPRFNAVEYYQPIKQANLFLFNKLKNSTCHLVKSKDLFSRKDFLPKGPHLNRHGKEKLSKTIISKFNEIQNFVSLPYSTYSSGRISIECNEVTSVDENLEAFSKLGQILKANSVVAETSDLSDEEILEKVSPLKIDPDTKSKLVNLLKEYKCIFSDNPGKHESFTATFRFANSDVYVKRSYPIPVSSKQLVRNEIQRLVKLGIIETSSAPFSNPLVPVIKKDGTCRLCLDARNLNKILVSDAESPENIDSLLFRFHDPKCVSCLDFSAGFLQIPLSEGSRDATSFVFEGKNYRFSRVPFGTKVSMQLFMKALDCIFGPEFHDFLSKFVDDLRIVSSLPSLHLEHLRSVFEKIKSAGLTLNFKKCKFFQDEVDFLGYIISQDGIKMDPKKVEAIRDFPTPRNIKQLQSWLGLVNFYRKFHMDHASLTQPLMHLLKKGAVWEWGEKEEAAFSKMKDVFIDKIVLKYPDFRKAFFLNTDYSGIAIAGELYQFDDDGNRRPVCFYSKALTTAERNYTTTEGELLAIVKCCAKWREFILNFPVICTTDCSALIFLNKCVLTTGRLTRWALYLQQFDLKIQHIKGSENISADILSRHPPSLHSLPSNDLEFKVNAFRFSVPKEVQTKFSELSVKQQNDPKLGPIFRDLSAETGSRAAACHKLFNDTLFYRGTRDSSWKLCIPEELVVDTIKTAHESIGHFGSKKTYEYLKLFCKFPRMEKRSRKFVANCLPCLKCKSSNESIHAPLVPVLAERPLGLLSVDLFGPLPTSKGNFTYVFVLIDVFSKFVKLYPLRRGTGLLVSRRLSNYLEEVGKPGMVIFDRGPCFRSHTWYEKLKSEGILFGHSSVYHPQSNPVERQMRVIGNFCRLYCSDQHTSWVEFLNFFEDCMNNTFCESTGFAPIEIMKECSPNNFLSNLVNFPPDKVLEPIERKLILVNNKLKSKAQMRKERHDKKFKLYEFQIGHKVLVKNFLLSNAALGKIKKFFCLYNGPFVIIDKVGLNAFKVKEIDSDEIIGTYNSTNLKPYFGNQF